MWVFPSGSSAIRKLAPKRRSGTRPSVGSRGYDDLPEADLCRALKQGGGQGIAGGGAGRMLKALVIVEIALSVTLLAGAGILIKSFVALSNVALGFRPDKLLVMGIN